MFQKGGTRIILNSWVCSILILSIFCSEFFVSQKIVFSADLPTVDINEVCWMGSSKSASDEWLELKNNSDQNIDLTGWTLKAASSTPSINLVGKILANDYFLFERTDDNSVPNVQADQIYIGALSNAGENLELRDAQNNLIDFVEAKNGWPAGDNVANLTMERKTDGGWQNSLVAGGTPKSINNYQLSINNGDANAISTASTTAITTSQSTTTIQSNINQTISQNNNSVATTTTASSTQINYDYSNDILITEILPNPAGDDGLGEFFEVYNRGTQPVDLIGWQLKAGVKKFEFKNTIIYPKNYYAVFRLLSGLVLKNSSSTIQLFQPLKTTAMQTINYGIAKSGQSFSLNEDGTWQWTNKPTPGMTNAFELIIEPVKTVTTTTKIIKQETTKKSDALSWQANASSTELTSSGSTTAILQSIKSVSAKIVINEFLPNPIGSDTTGEWIELLNRGTGEVDLLNWGIKTQNNKIFKFKASNIIRPNNYFVLNRQVSGLALNNSKGSLSLLSDSGNLIDTVNYNSTKQGFSYARKNNNTWSWTRKITPGKANVLAGSLVVAKTTTKKVAGVKIVSSIGPVQSNNLRTGQLVRIKGTVLVEPGIVGTQIFYIATPVGLQIYNYKKDFPSLKVGDYVEVTGEVAESNGEQRLKTKTLADIRILGQKELPEPLEINCDKIDDQVPGQLIKITGEITKKTGSSVYLDDGTDEALVYLKTAAKINKKELLEGEQYEIIGLLNKTKSGLRLLPRSIADIVKIQSADAAVQGEVSASSTWALDPRDQKAELLQYLLVVFGGVILVLAGWLIKKQKDDH